METHRRKSGTGAGSMLQRSATPADGLRQGVCGVRRITHIIVHCSATPGGRDIGVAEIDREHRRRGFNSIGYHWVVRLDGRVERGRAETVAGAHCRGLNACSVGVCYVGGTDAQGRPRDTRTQQQRMALRLLLSDLRRRYPGARIFGHRDFAPKACPCFDATKEYARL